MKLDFDLVKEYYDLRDKRLSMERMAHKNKYREDELKNIIVECVKSKAEMPRNFDIRVKEGGRFPKWKEEFIQRLGEDVANQVISATPFREELEVIFCPGFADPR